MQLLNEKLYTDESTKGTRAAKKVKIDKKPVLVGRAGPTAIEFAYMIKTSEEQGRDCDDAERILSVLYNTFKSMCSYRTNPKNNPERFIQVYKQQLSKFYESLATAKTVFAATSECKAHFNNFVSWLNQCEVFNTISEDTPMDDTGKVCIDTAYDYRKAKDSSDKILEFIRRGAKDPDEAETEEVTEE